MAVYSRTNTTNNQSIISTKTAELPSVTLSDVIISSFENTMKEGVGIKNLDDKPLLVQNAETDEAKEKETDTRKEKESKTQDDLFKLLSKREDSQKQKDNRQTDSKPQNTNDRGRVSPSSGFVPNRRTPMRQDNDLSKLLIHNAENKENNTQNISKDINSMSKLLATSPIRKLKDTTETSSRVSKTNKQETDSEKDKDTKKRHGLLISGLMGSLGGLITTGFTKTNQALHKAITTPSHILEGIHKNMKELGNKSLSDLLWQYGPMFVSTMGIIALAPKAVSSIMKILDNIPVYWQTAKVWMAQTFTGPNSIFQKAWRTIQDWFSKLGARLMTSDNVVVSWLGRALAGDKVSEKYSVNVDQLKKFASTEEGKEALSVFTLGTGSEYDVYDTLSVAKQLGLVDDEGNIKLSNEDLKAVGAKDWEEYFEILARKKYDEEFLQGVDTSRYSDNLQEFQYLADFLIGEDASSGLTGGMNTGVGVQFNGRDLLESKTENIYSLYNLLSQRMGGSFGGYNADYNTAVSNVTDRLISTFTTIDDESKEAKFDINKAKSYFTDKEGNVDKDMLSVVQQLASLGLFEGDNTKKFAEALVSTYKSSAANKRIKDAKESGQAMGDLLFMYSALSNEGMDTGVTLDISAYDKEAADKEAAIKQQQYTQNYLQNVIRRLSSGEQWTEQQWETFANTPGEIGDTIRDAIGTYQKKYGTINYASKNFYEILSEKVDKRAKENWDVTQNIIQTVVGSGNEWSTGSAVQPAGY